MHANFAHLHVHTQYSLLDGACLIDELLKLACANKLPAIAITDHGNMFGVIEFYQRAMEFGVKPIIGCEVYVAPDSRFEKSAHGIQEASFHLILLAKDEVGYKNLIRLVSLGYLEGFYYRPRIDKELLKKYSKGLVCLSSCLKGEIPYLIQTDRIEEMQAVANEFKESFEPGDFYFELMDNSIPEQNKVNECLIEYSKKLGIPLVATGDIHYLKKEDAKAHEALLCIQTQTTLEDPNRLRFQTDEFYFKTPQQMGNAFSHCPEAIKNSIQITEKCNLELDFTKTHLPQFQPPEGKTESQFLTELCEEGLRSKYGAISEEVKKRTAHELGIINSSGYTSYFLIAWDFVRYAKSRGIPVGPGRGSAAGSIVSYALGITNIDPLKYDLLFERFLNPERVSLPDIDIDFCYERRSEVIDYVIKKYSKDNVAQIITFGTMLAKAVLRDVARVMNFPYAEADRIAKLVPNDLNITLTEALEREPELKVLYKNDPRITQLINTSMVLEGLTRHASTHAAGVVISDRPLIEHIPLFKTGDEQITTGLPMTSLEKVGLLKMDFLGLRTLTVIDETIKIVKKTKAQDFFDVTQIPIDDPNTFKLLSNAETIGVFQLESSGMRELLKKLKPSKFEDIIAVLALFRPGPIGSGMTEDFIARKHKKVPIKYDHPKLEPILNQTYGIIVYQEQVMRIANELAGFSLSQADNLRRAMSKKTPEVMEEAREHFIKGAVKNGVDKKIAEKTFNLIEYFSGYGFNRSHSTAYAMISYRTAYLKANFPVEFMTALLTSEKDNMDKIVEYIDEANRMGISVLPPDVEESFAKFTVIDAAAKNGIIKFGLSAVKNVGQGAIDSIIEARKKAGGFKTLFEFFKYIDTRLANKKVIESLVKCGAFDRFGHKRSSLFSVVDKLLNAASNFQRDRQGGQYSFFDIQEDTSAFKASAFVEIPDIPEWPENQLLAAEKEMLGFYITKHPLTRYQGLLEKLSTCPTQKLSTRKDGEEISIGGILSKVRPTITKRTGEKMAIATLEDLDGTVEVLFFPSCYQKAAGYIKKDNFVYLRGRLSLREEEPKIIANEISNLEEAFERFSTSMTVVMHNNTSLQKEDFEQLKKILSQHQGDIPVYITFTTKNNERVEMRIGKELYVKPSIELVSEVEGLLGEGTVVVKC